MRRERIVFVRGRPRDREFLNLSEFEDCVKSRILARKLEYANCNIFWGHRGKGEIVWESKDSLAEMSTFW